MHGYKTLLLLAGLVLTGGAHAAKDKLPGRDLTVELRQIEETHGDPVGYVVSAQSGTEVAALTYQKLLVRNGEKASVQMHQSTPKQWTQSVSGSAVNGATSSMGVNNTLEWLQAGYSVTVQPRWSGGNKAVVVELELEQKDLQTIHNADMPQQSRRQYTSTVTVPLAQWVTISASGEVPKAGVYSTSTRHRAGRQALQIRILVP
jgi:hypothetical protein